MSITFLYRIMRLPAKRRSGPCSLSRIACRRPGRRPFPNKTGALRSINLNELCLTLEAALVRGAGSAGSCRWERAHRKPGCRLPIISCRCLAAMRSAPSWRRGRSFGRSRRSRPSSLRGLPSSPPISPFTTTSCGPSSCGRRKWRRLTRAVSPKPARGSTRSRACGRSTRPRSRPDLPNSCPGRPGSKSVARSSPRSRPGRKGAVPPRPSPGDQQPFPSPRTRSARSTPSGPRRRAARTQARSAPMRLSPASESSRARLSLIRSMSQATP